MSDFKVHVFAGQLIISIALFLFALFVLKMVGLIVFVDRIHAFQEMFVSLGSSIIFFSANLIVFIYGCLKLRGFLKDKDSTYSDVRFWDSILNLSLSLFFGIGVLYTAVGMMHAFQVTLGEIDQAVATSLGPWGVLERLVKGGLLMALNTTIVGGALGYGLRFFKSLLFGKSLIRLQEQYQAPYQAELIKILQRIEQRLNT